MNLTPKSDAKLTPKQLEFVKQLIDNKKISGGEAARRAYNTTTDNAARAIASENLTKPNIVSYLEQHSELAESAVIDTIKDWKKAQNTRQREIATNLAMYVHDKVHGKATQRIEQQSVSVAIEIDLT